MQKYLNRFSVISRLSKSVLQFVADAALISMCFFTTMVLMVDDFDFAEIESYLEAFVTSIITTLITFWMFGLYSVVLRFITGKILVIVATGTSVMAISLYAADQFWGADLPLSALIIFPTFSFLTVGGLRFGARTYLRNKSQFSRQPVIIYGAGEAGLQLLNALFHGHEYLPVALVDDDTSLKKLNVGGLRVYSPDKILSLIKKTRATAVLLALPSMSPSRRRKIVKELAELPIEVKTIPKMSDLVNGNAEISELRTVSTVDLLGREPISPNPKLLSKNIKGRVVMVTGAGGSIGSEICKQILTQMPSVLILFEVSEFALYSIETELTKMLPTLHSKIRIVPVLGSVQHCCRVEATIQAFRVQTIFHAAAYKHVPLVEQNIVEGIQNNVFGTLTVTRAARKLGVENFILISTDKAVRPTNIMGATKRIAELICQAQSLDGSATVFSMVRFGNVLGSSGSVIPLFQSQIENGGPITVTHQDITRYFMTIPEAAQLVIQAGALGHGGDVFVLDMGKPVKILDLAFSMVKLHGLVPYMVDNQNQISPEKGDIPVCITGLRKGEKLYEELLIGKNSQSTKHPRIMTASEVALPEDTLTALLDRLHRACEDLDLQEIIAIFHELPLEYAPSTRSSSNLSWITDNIIERELNLPNEKDVCT
jgi:FlaA1/EpsC-like NDP-sugar epimerase